MYIISIYKLGDVGISSNLIGSLSLAYGQCPLTRRREICEMKTITGVNCRVAVVIEGIFASA